MAGLANKGKSGLMRVLLVLGLACWGLALAISYTVQVVAVSDEERALLIQDALAEEGFPAYVLTVPTQEGLVYRLRIGAFANRAAAARFAERLPPFFGAPATPALAESIPSGLIPLEPEWLGSYPAGSQVEALDWPGGPALRTQTGDAPARYRLPDGTSFEAFRALPQQGGVLLVEALRLWPEGWESLSEAERVEYRQTVLGNVAAGLELAEARLADFVFHPEGEAPFLVLAERRDASGARVRLRALGQPGSGFGPEGPELAWLEPAAREDIQDPEALWRVADQPAPAPSVTGAGWQATADEGFVRLLREGRSWRAASGAPLWAAGELLAVLDRGEVVVYALKNSEE